MNIWATNKKNLECQSLNFIIAKDDVR
jgi:hypothetical protein